MTKTKDGVSALDWMLATGTIFLPRPQFVNALQISSLDVSEKSVQSLPRRELDFWGFSQYLHLFYLSFEGISNLGNACLDVINLIGSFSFALVLKDLASEKYEIKCSKKKKKFGIYVESENEIGPFYRESENESSEEAGNALHSGPAAKISLLSYLESENELPVEPTAKMSLLPYLESENESPVESTAKINLVATERKDEVGLAVESDEDEGLFDQGAEDDINFELYDEYLLSLKGELLTHPTFFKLTQ